MYSNALYNCPEIGDCSCNGLPSELSRCDFCESGYILSKLAEIDSNTTDKYSYNEINKNGHRTCKVDIFQIMLLLGMIISMAGIVCWWWSREDDRSITVLEEELRHERLSIGRKSTQGHEQHGLPLDEECMKDNYSRKRSRRKRMKIKTELKRKGTVRQRKRSMKRDQLSKEYFLTRNKHIPRAKRFK